MRMACGSNKRRYAGRASRRVLLTSLLSSFLLVAASTVALGAPAAGDSIGLSPSEILQKNAEARGGTEAWQKLRTMVWAGHTESSAAPQRRIPFLLEMKRPARMRFELVSPNGKLVRIYDGGKGWKVRPDSQGLPDLQDYSDDELAFARSAQIIDGPLMDFAAKGANFRRVGMDTLDGREAIVLQAHLSSGDGARIWVDAESFLEMKLERQIRLSTGKSATSTIAYRDYRPFNGLQIAVIVETGAGPGGASDKLVIEKVALDPDIDDQTFVKPQVAARRHGGVVVDTRSAARRATPQDSVSE